MEYGVKLGSMLFTMIEPHRGFEVEYNRWYERDHFYAGCMIGAFCFAGGRWVATRDLKALRYPDPSPIAPSREVGSFLSLYYILDGHRQQWRTWGADQVFRLDQEGRMYRERDHVHTLHYVYRWGAFRDADGVPAELALDHRFPGLAVVIGERAPGVFAADVERWYMEERLPKMLLGTPAAMCLSFEGEASMPKTPSNVPPPTGVEDRFLLTFFLDSDPRECWTDLFAGHGDDLSASGLGSVIYASPFVPTVPGTDRYLDELW
jgi:hypothetical protein